MANYKRIFLDGYSYYITLVTHERKIISTIKRHFSKHCPKEHYAHLHQSYHRNRQGYLPIWQKRFYEHTIRDEKDFQEKLTYIHNNPVKHGYVDNIYAWQYGSLYKSTPRQTPIPPVGVTMSHT